MKRFVWEGHSVILFGGFPLALILIVAFEIVFGSAHTSYGSISAIPCQDGQAVQELSDRVVRLLRKQREALFGNRTEWEAENTTDPASVQQATLVSRVSSNGEQFVLEKHRVFLGEMGGVRTSAAIWDGRLQSRSFVANVLSVQTDPRALAQHGNTSLRIYRRSSSHQQFSWNTLFGSSFYVFGDPVPIDQIIEKADERTILSQSSDTVKVLTANSREWGNVQVDLARSGESWRLKRISITKLPGHKQGILDAERRLATVVIGDPNSDDESLANRRQISWEFEAIGYSDDGIVSHWRERLGTIDADGPNELDYSQSWEVKFVSQTSLDGEFPDRIDFEMFDDSQYDRITVHWDPKVPYRIENGLPVKVVDRDLVERANRIGDRHTTPNITIEERLTGQRYSARLWTVGLVIVGLAIVILLVWRRVHAK